MNKEEQSQSLAAGNFSIKVSGSEFTMHYRRNAKDWLDFIVKVGLGAIFGVIAFFVTQLLIEDFNIFLLLITVGCVFGVVLQLATGLSRLFQTTDSLMVINMSELRIQYYPWKTLVLTNKQIHTIRLEGHIESTLNLGQKRVYCEIRAITKDDKATPICVINPHQILRTSDREIEVELYKIGKKLAKIIAEKVGATYQWTGFPKE